MFTPNTIVLPEGLLLTQPIQNEDTLLTCQLTQFDREGYELLPIEQEYYKANNINLHTEQVFALESGSTEGWQASLQKWFIQEEEHSKYRLDHSFCVMRYGFDGEAKEQLKRLSKFRPELKKLLNIIPKWGTDFCVDYITADECFELVHWEWDFRDVYELDHHVETMEHVVQNTDWESIEDAVRYFNQFNHNVDAEAEGNFKANLFGLPRAIRLYKGF